MKSRYQVVELGKHIRQISTRNRSDANIEVFSVTNSEGFKRSTEYFSKEVFSKDVSNYKVVEPGLFAYNPSRINVGSIDFLRHSSSVLVSPLYIIFDCDEDIYSDYLLRYLKSDWGNAQIRKNTEGAVRDSLKYKGLEKIKLPLPPLNDQIQIAHLLGNVEGLIAKRKQHLQQLDNLIKSFFLEMFGDPVRNEMGWDKKVFGDLLLDIESGKSPKCEARPATDNEWGVLKLGAVTRCVFDASENKALPAATAPIVKHEVKAGDILFSRKNTHELVAACAYVYETPSKRLMPDLIFRFVFNDDAEVNPIYIWKLLTNDSQRKAIQAFAAGAAGSMPNISKANLKTAKLPVPPIDLQNQFCIVVEKVEALKSRYQHNLTDLESLYGSLSQQAFKGELDLARILLPDTEPEVQSAVTPFLEPADLAPIISLPDNGSLKDALTDENLIKALIDYWLESYRNQLGKNDFSVRDFIAAAQTRIAEVHPDDDFELGASNYDQIKDWVFDALAAGELNQDFDDKNNRIELKVGQAGIGQG